MPAVLAGGVLPALPAPQPESVFYMRHPSVPSTLLAPVLTTQSAYDAVWFALGWLVFTWT